MFSKYHQMPNHVIQSLTNKRIFLHNFRCLKAFFLLLVLCSSMNSALAQTKKTSSKSDKKPVQKVQPKTIDTSTTKLPEYYLSYAHGGDFRSGKVASAVEQEAFGYILPIPVILTSRGEDANAMNFWKEAVRKCFVKNDSKVFMKTEVVSTDTIKVVPQRVDEVHSDGDANSNLERLAIDLPYWVMPYLENDLDLGKLYQYQIKVGNVLYCDEKTFFPLLVDGSATTMEVKLKEADKYYNAIYWWAASYPELFYGLDDQNLFTALKEKRKEIIYHFGLYRFLLNDDLKATFVRQDKTLKKPQSTQ
jgi:hypothetical protein